MKKPVKALYTPSEVARLLGRPKQTVSRWIRQGLLQTVQMGSQRLVPIAALKTPAIVWQSILVAAQANGTAARLSA